MFGATSGGLGCDVMLHLLSAADTADDPWTVEWSSSTTTITSTSGAYIDSGDVGFPVEVGVYYATLIEYDCSATGDTFAYDWSGVGASTGDAGVGTTVGRWSHFSGTYSGPSGATADSYFNTSSTRYLGTVSWAH